MEHLYNVLWIEEETEFNLLEVKSYLESNPMLKIEVADTYLRYSEIMKLRGEVFDIFIVDILIPKDYDKNRTLDTYGLDIIEELHELNLSEKACIFTNEVWDAVQKRISEKLPRERYMQKNECRTNRAFEKFILKIVA